MLRGVPTYGFNSYFDQIQRGKKSMTLDLHFERARQAMYKLVEGADVFVTNLRMRGLERLGVDYETLSRLNPRLVYALGTGWGMKGPGRDRGGFEVTGAAGSGVLTNFAERGARPPLWPPATGRDQRGRAGDSRSSNARMLVYRYKRAAPKQRP